MVNGYTITPSQRNFLLHALDVVEENLQYNDEEEKDEREYQERKIAECTVALKARRRNLYTGRWRR